MGKPGHGWGTRAALFLIVALFAASRYWYVTEGGLRFHTGPIQNFVQIMDPVLLKSDLLRTVLYTHTQPPLFNLAIGAGLKLFPEMPHFAIACWVAYSMMGLLFSLSLYLLMTALGAHRSLALLVTALHTVSPATVRYEYWLFYAYPIATLLCVAALLLHKALATRQSLWVFLYFLTLATLTLTRSTLTWMWFAICAGALIVAAGKDRPRFARLAAFPALLVGLLCVRQLVLFGSLTVGDAFLGGNLAEKLAKSLSAEQRRDLEERKLVSPLFYVLLHSDIEVVKSVVPSLRPTGVAVLDAGRKSNGQNNFNNLHYREMSRRQLVEVRAALLAYPWTYLKSVLSAGLLSFSPSSDDYWLRKTVRFSEKGERLADLWDTLISGEGDPDHRKPAWILVLVLPMAFAYGVARVTFRPGGDLTTRLTLGFLAFNVLFVTALTCAASVSDFNRYRFDVDAFYLVLLTLAISEGIRAAVNRMNTRAGAPTSP